MTKKNPDDSVHEEQSEAKENVHGTEDAIHAETTQDPKPVEDAENHDDNSEDHDDESENHDDNSEKIAENIPENEKVKSEEKSESINWIWFKKKCFSFFAKGNL